MRKTTGSPDVALDFAGYDTSSADKAMYENTLNIALNRTCINDLCLCVSYVILTFLCP